MSRKGETKMKPGQLFNLPVSGCKAEESGAEPLSTEDMINTLKGKIAEDIIGNSDVLLRLYQIEAGKDLAAGAFSPRKYYDMVERMEAEGLKALMSNPEARRLLGKEEPKTEDLGDPKTEDLKTEDPEN